MIEEKLVKLIDKSNTYIGEPAVDVDNCQWIRFNGGETIIYFGKYTYDQPRYTIFMRDESNEVVCKLADEIYHKLANYTEPHFAITMLRLPLFVGRDEKYRSVYSLQIECHLGGY